MHVLIRRRFKGEESVTRLQQATGSCLALSVGLELYLDKRCGNERRLEGISDCTCTPNSVICTADPLFLSPFFLFVFALLTYFMVIDTNVQVWLTAGEICFTEALCLLLYYRTLLYGYLWLIEAFPSST